MHYLKGKEHKRMENGWNELIISLYRQTNNGRVVRAQVPSSKSLNDRAPFSQWTTPFQNGNRWVAHCTLWSANEMYTKMNTNLNEWREKECAVAVAAALRASSRESFTLGRLWTLRERWVIEVNFICTEALAQNRLARLFPNKTNTVTQRLTGLLVFYFLRCHRDTKSCTSLASLVLPF